MGKKELDLVIKAIAEAKEITRKGDEVKVYIPPQWVAGPIYPQQLKDMLLKLQHDENIIKIKSFPNCLLPTKNLTERLTKEALMSRLELALNPGERYFTIEVRDGFDKWLLNYRAKRKSSTEDLLPIRSEKVISSPKPEITYRITFTKAREILLNDSYQIATPDFDRENEQVFSYLYNHPNEKFTTKQIEGESRINLVKSFHKIVENLGFTGALRKAFFNVGKDSIQFKNPITSKELAASVVAELNSLIAKA